MKQKRLQNRWTNEKLDVLQYLWERGCTAREISLAFQKWGYPVSRNAVVGTIHWYGFKRNFC